MPDATVDPRRRGFSAPLRPVQPAQTVARRGITGPPPPKPVTPAAPAPDDESTGARPAWQHPAESVTSSALVTPSPPASPVTQPPSRVEDTRTRLGVQRHNMRYVQFQVSPVLSDLLTARAEAEDVVLGEVVMDALRAFEAQSKPAVTLRRRRRSNVTVRRSILVRPEEADQIKAMANQYSEKPSGLIRRSLESYLT